MELILAVVGGFTLGCIHAFDVDHVAAVTALSSKHGNPRKASLLGAVWGLGHTATLVLFGTASVALKFVIPDAVVSIAELLVGFMLIAIGVWVVRDVIRHREIHIHRHTHDGMEHVHFHSHAKSEEHNHSHSLFFVGAAHGFAGTAAVLVLIPIAISQSILNAVIYLVLFGIGTMSAMAFFAYWLGVITKKIPSTRGITLVRGAAGVVSLVVGLIWVGGFVL
ncbi:MAG: urease accessory protein [Ignavibacteria bacterium]|nr:urease accessory protein [Ignavibacteria bacterium]